jgi:hypothetical protein
MLEDLYFVIPKKLFTLKFHSTALLFRVVRLGIKNTCCIRASILLVSLLLRYSCSDAKARTHSFRNSRIQPHLERAWEITFDPSRRCTANKGLVGYNFLSRLVVVVRCTGPAAESISTFQTPRSACASLRKRGVSSLPSLIASPDVSPANI